MAFLQDALVQCNTVACVKGFKVILGEMTPLYLNIAFTTWSHGYVNDPKFIDEIMVRTSKNIHNVFSLSTLLCDWKHRLYWDLDMRYQSLSS